MIYKICSILLCVAKYVNVKRNVCTDSGPTIHHYRPNHSKGHFPRATFDIVLCLCHFAHWPEIKDEAENVLKLRCGSLCWSGA